MLTGGHRGTEPGTMNEILKITHKCGTQAVKPYSLSVTMMNTKAMPPHKIAELMIDEILSNITIFIILSIRSIFVK